MHDPHAEANSGRAPSLFRREVIEAATQLHHGDVIGGAPPRWSALLVMLPCMGLLLWLYFGHYTRTVGISGQLVPRGGQVDVTTPQGGEVVDCTVAEGTPVQPGDVLFTLRSARASTTTGATEPAVVALLQDRRNSLLREQQSQQLRRHEQSAAISSQRAAQLAELRQIDSQITLQRRRADIAAEALERYQSLYRDGFVSQLQWQDKQSELLDQQQRLAELERGQVVLRRSIEAAENEWREQRWQSERAVEALQRELASVDESTVEVETRREWSVRAPRAGVVSGILAVTGQNVPSGTTLATLIPQPTVLEAELSAPSRAAGFLRAGLSLQLRHHAYPYQKFGLQEATIREVSAVALRGDTQSEPVYRIRATLRQQALRVEGRWEPLKPGARVDASVLLDRRRLYEWLLEPLRSLRSWN